MATLDEILGGSSRGSGGTQPPKGTQEWAKQHSGENAGSGGTQPPKGTQEWAEQHSGENAGSGGTQPPKGTQEWAEQHSGENAPVSSAGSAPQAPAKQKDTQPTKTGTPEGGGGYEALFRQLNPYTPPTAEQIAEEKKKYKRQQIFNAIGDGIMALSNLFFTTRGAPNMYSGRNTMSERAKIRYDKLMKDHDDKNAAYFNGLFRAKQADEAAAHRERVWQRQLGLDKKNDDRYNEGIRHRNEREKIADDRWQTEFDENKRRSDRSYKRHQDNMKARKEKAARGVRSKQLGFSDGDGNQVAIYENVWEGSMPSIYDALVADGIGPTAYERVNGMSSSEKDTFVKENWYKSEKAKRLMLALSKLDPATMVSELSDEVVEYVPGGGDEDVIDYTPGKNK